VPPPSEGNEEVATLEVSIESGGQAINRSSKVLVKRERSNILIQTDKSVYKPGQTGKNRIGQWLNVSLQQGIADLSLPLSSEPPLGEYSIRVKDTVHTFSVEEYVLPKFEVTLQFPKVVTVSEEHFTLKLCSRYTYGKPVQGEFTSAVCRKALNYYWMRRQYEKPIDLCVYFSGKLDKSGCSTEQVKTETFNLNSRNGLSSDLVGTASITEEGTGIVLSTSSQTSISSVITKVTFVDADNSYKPGIPYSGTLKVVDASDSPLPDKVIYLTCSDPGSGTNQTLVTDENGRASFKLENTTHWVDSVNLRARTTLETHSYNYDYNSPEHTDGYLSLRPFYSRSNSFLKLHSMERTLPCEGKQEVRVEYIIPRKELEKDAKHLELHYLVTAKGTLQDYGNVQIPIKSEEDVLQGEVSLQLPLSVDVSPTLRALVYILLPDGELVADSAKFNVMRCFKNKAAVQFTPDEVLPGSDVSLRVQAAAGSLCALRVVDQSVVLMKPERELSADQVHNLFPFPDFGGYDYRVQDTEPNSCEQFNYQGSSFLLVRPVRPPRRPSRSSIIHPWYTHDAADIYSLFKEKTETVRTYFPETWIWELTAVGESGSADLHYSAPDTITDWSAGAFCMGPSGFGLSSPASLRTFQPFFVELTLPYSVVRGETFTLKASVFNYLKQCIKIQATLKPSLELQEEPCADCQYSSCLCADESKTFYWSLTAAKLGEVNITVQTEALDMRDLCHNEVPIVPKQGSIDTVIRPLLVQPGGVLEEKSHSSLLCSQEGEDPSKTEEISLKVPENILKDSERAHVTVLEYQRQLTYKHETVFIIAPSGRLTQRGTTWLTAFVLKSFSKCRPYIFSIDEKVPLNHSKKSLGYGQLHWQRKSLSPASDLPFWYRAPSVEVELTSYMLLTHLSGPEKDLGKASEIVNWLSKQQNPYGGFSSTQDTVVALQALAKYAEATFSDKGDVTVRVRSQAGFLEKFHVDNSNRLLLQRASLSDIPGEYTVTATGSGCVYVQTVLRYNVPPPKSDATFEVRVETDPKECPKDPQRNFEIHINAKYTGSREKSNMALIEVKMLSGYIPVKSSVRKLEKEKLIQRSDIKTDMVTLYLDELRHDSLHLSFLVEQDILVKNLKPATVKVYDYYET
ncbi:hypothetical protein FKM82_014428, partial [Ascaphus truei]